jgi:hypothetical protein
MRRVKPNSDGTVRCWRCGSTAFTSQRTMKGCLAFGLLARQQMKCMGCGAFSRPGRAGAAKRAHRTGPPLGPPPMLAPIPPPQGPPPGWYADPNGQPVQRWWDGYLWTEHTQGEVNR